MSKLLGKPDCRNEGLGAPLYAALRQGHCEVIRLLIEARADASAACNDDGTTPLHAASLYGHLDCLDLLISAGARIAPRPAIRASNSDDALHKASSQHAKKATQLVTPLHIASQHGHVACARSLLDANADVDAKTPKGYTSLHLAGESGHAGACALLLAAGAAVRTRTLRGYTALHFAASQGRTPCVRCLLEAQCEPDVRSASRCTPLHLAARGGHTDCLELLIDVQTSAEALRIYVSLTNGEGDAALLMAADYGHANCVRLLLLAGASPNGSQGSGGSPLFLATAKGHSECVRLLVEAGASENATPTFEPRSGAPHPPTERHEQTRRRKKSPDPRAAAADVRSSSAPPARPGMAPSDPPEGALPPSAGPDEPCRGAAAPSAAPPVAGAVSGRGGKSWLVGLLHKTGLMGLSPPTLVAGKEYSNLNEDDSSENFMELDMISP